MTKLTMLLCCWGLFLIPKIIHQIWLGPLTPPSEVMESWRLLHPQWEYRLWTEDNLPKLQNQKAFEKSTSYPQKADILRYELLYQFGGVYVDADELCLKSIDGMVDEWNESSLPLVMAYEGSKQYPKLIANTVMASIANNPFIGKLVDQIDVSVKGDPWQVTGPMYLTDMFEVLRPEANILDSRVFYPIHHRDKENRDINLKVLSKDPSVYGVHTWSGTKRSYEPKWYRSPLAYIVYLARRKLKKTFQLIQ